MGHRHESEQHLRQTKRDELVAEGARLERQRIIDDVLVPARNEQSPHNTPMIDLLNNIIGAITG